VKPAAPTPADFSETRIDSEAVFEGRLLKVRRDTVRLPDGNTATREYILTGVKKLVQIQ